MEIHIFMTLQRMAKQGASLQNYNNELVKSMEVTKTECEFYQMKKYITGVSEEKSSVK